MKRILTLFLLVSSFSLFSQVALVVNSVSGTLSYIDTDSGQINNNFAQLGTTPNLIDVADNRAYLVNSGDNSVQVIDLLSGNTLSNIYIEDSANPWYAKVDNNYLYVTGFFTNKLYKIDLSTEDIIAEIIVGQAPTGIEIYQDKIYVTCTGGYVNNYAESQVSIIDKESFTLTSSIATSLNPQYVDYHNGLLYVMCTGNWEDELGKVDVIDPESVSLITSIPIGGNIGKAAFLGNRAYITDAMNIGIYQIDTQTNTVINDATNPLTPGGSTIATNGVNIAYINASWGSNGIVWFTDNNLENGLSYEVALSPTDIIFWNAPTPNQDNDVTPAPLRVTTYPNPASYVVNFSVESASKSSNKVKIFNLKGQLVDQFESSDNNFSWNKQKTSNQLANGIYFYKISKDKHSTQGKFILIK